MWQTPQGIEFDAPLGLTSGLSVRGCPHINRRCVKIDMAIRLAPRGPQARQGIDATNICFFLIWWYPLLVYF